AAIQDGEVARGVLEIVRMKIPAAECHRDATGARLDKAPGDQEMLGHAGCAVHPRLRVPFAVTLDYFSILTLIIQRIEQTVRGKHSKSAFVERVKPFHLAAAIHVPAKLI